MALIPVDEALRFILADAEAVSSECVELVAAFGRVLADDILSPIDVPPAANSAMDGYALRASDWSGRDALRVSRRIVAGAVVQPLEPGTAARIFTGAELPAGADTVAMQEDCSEQNGFLFINGAIGAGQNVRPRGQDVRRGQRLAAKSEPLDAARVALLAGSGIAAVPVYRRLRVALLSTGDELVEPGAPLQPGQIYNSNRPLLTGLLRSMGCEVSDFGIVADDADATAQALLAATAGADCIITTGGVSAGEEDHVRAQIERHGELRLWKLNIKPGKPLAYGRMRDVPVFGLPGNPASSFVTFLVVVRPYLLRMLGRDGIQPLRLPAAFAWPKPGQRQEYLRVRISGEAKGVSAELYPNQSSGVLHSVAWGNALAVVPPAQAVQPGDLIEVIPYREWW